MADFHECFDAKLLPLFVQKLELHDEGFADFVAQMFVLNDSVELLFIFFNGVGENMKTNRHSIIARKHISMFGHKLVVAAVVDVSVLIVAQELEQWLCHKSYDDAAGHVQRIVDDGEYIISKKLHILLALLNDKQPAACGHERG